jgi:23S rRNA pseudouridine2605 synthase
MTERLQKILARAGFGSRRTCEEFIRQGRVSVDGRVAQLGETADGDKNLITLDGQPIVIPSEYIYIMLNKPRGVLSSSRSQGGHPTLFDYVNIDERVFPIGRLDLDSEGLIILTDDGGLTHRLTHPSYKHEKEYLVQLDQTPTDDQLQRWRDGIHLPEGGITLPADVRTDIQENDARWIRIVLREGRKRQIRVSAEDLGLCVIKLIRVRHGSLELGELKPGKWRYLLPEEIQSLKATVSDNENV